MPGFAQPVEQRSWAPRLLGARSTRARNQWPGGQTRTGGPRPQRSHDRPHPDQVLHAAGGGRPLRQELRRSGSRPAAGAPGGRAGPSRDTPRRMPHQRRGRARRRPVDVEMTYSRRRRCPSDGVGAAPHHAPETSTPARGPGSSPDRDRPARHRREVRISRTLTLIPGPMGRPSGHPACSGKLHPGHLGSRRRSPAVPRPGA